MKKDLLKIEELKNELYTGDYGEYFRDYANGYICDIISEIADSNTDIYTSNLLEWSKNNYSYIEDSINEFGTPKDSNDNADFIKMIQQGQYYAITQDLYNYLEDSLKYYMYDYIEKDLNIGYISEEQNDELLNWDFDDNNESLENLIEHIEDVLRNNIDNMVNDIIKEYESEAN